MDLPLSDSLMSNFCLYMDSFLSISQLDEVHSQFVAALNDLIERHKARVGFADVELKIL